MKFIRLMLCISLMGVSGCSDIATTGVTGLGYSIAQERSVGNAIEKQSVVRN